MFEQLQVLVTTHQWQEADQETARLLMQLANRGEEAWLYEEHIQSLPDEALQTIDQIWLEASDHRFGFSVQQRIYEELIKTELTDKQPWGNFYAQIGWTTNEKYFLLYKDLTFALKPDTPLGHLPGIMNPYFCCRYGSNTYTDWHVDLGGGEYLESHTPKNFFDGSRLSFLMRYSQINNGVI